MRKIANCIILTFCLSGLITAQERPFPQNIKYPYGFIPKTLDSDWLKSEYERWKKALLTTCSDNTYRVQGDPASESRVEVIGFGMLILAYMGAKTEFDGMYNFYKRNCSSAAGGMMNWEVTCNSVVASGSATDGDIDVAFALIVASWQWPDGGYLEKAKQVIKNLKSVVVTCGNLKALAMGYNFGGCNQTDISYYNPAAFREYAKVIGNTQDSAMWIKVADDTYTILNAGANKQTGLVADRQTTSGSPSGDYKYDACRTPWRICLDYLWNGNEKAKEWCIKVSNFAYNFGISKIREGFTLSGSPLSGTNHNMCYTGGFAIAAMANSQTMVDEFGTDLKKLHDTYWFTFTLTPCYLLTLTGNQWRNDLNEKQDTGKVALKNNIPAHSNASPVWNTISNHELLIIGCKPGYSIAVTALSGKQLYRATAFSEKVCIDISKMKTGCAIFTITDRSKNILKRGILSTL